MIHSSFSQFCFGICSPVTGGGCSCASEWMVRRIRRAVCCRIMRPNSFIHGTWLFHIWDMTGLYIWHDSFIYVTWLIYIAWLRDSFICVTWYIHVFYVTPSQAYGVASTSRLLKIIGLFCKRALYKRLYSTKETYNFKEPTNRSHPIARQCAVGMRHDSFNICDMTHSCMCFDSLIHVTWHIHTCDMTPSYMGHDSFTHVTRTIHICCKKGLLHTETHLCAKGPFLHTDRPLLNRTKQPLNRN